MSDIAMSPGEAIRDLMGEVCRACNGPKQPRKSHCRKCYFALSKAMRQSLYRRVGAGYEEAYAESLAHLRALEVSHG